MKTVQLALLILVAIAGAAGAFDLGSRAPQKPATAHTPPPVDPAMLRQGGDTVDDAVAVTLPYAGTGTYGMPNWVDDICVTIPDGAFLHFPGGPVGIQRDTTWGAVKKIFK